MGKYDLDIRKVEKDFTTSLNKFAALSLCLSGGHQFATHLTAIRCKHCGYTIDETRLASGPLRPYDPTDSRWTAEIKRWDAKIKQKQQADLLPALMAHITSIDIRPPFTSERIDRWAAELGQTPIGPALDRYNMFINNRDKTDEKCRFGTHSLVYENPENKHEAGYQTIPESEHLAVSFNLDTVEGVWCKHCGRQILKLTPSLRNELKTAQEPQIRKIIDGAIHDLQKSLEYMIENDWISVISKQKMARFLEARTHSEGWVEKIAHLSSEMRQDAATHLQSMARFGKAVDPTGSEIDKFIQDKESLYTRAIERLLSPVPPHEEEGQILQQLADFKAQQAILGKKYHDVENLDYLITLIEKGVSWAKTDKPAWDSAIKGVKDALSRQMKEITSKRDEVLYGAKLNQKISNIFGP